MNTNNQTSWMDPNEPVWAQQTMQPASSAGFVSATSSHNPGGRSGSANTFKSRPDRGDTLHWSLKLLRFLNVGLATFYVAAGAPFPHILPLL